MFKVVVEIDVVSYVLLLVDILDVILDMLEWLGVGSCL